MLNHPELGWGWEQEHELWATAATELPELELVDQASLALGYLVQELDESRASHTTICRALLLMAVMAFRTTRAAGLLIASGYSSEAFASARRLAEFAARAGDITVDRTGQRAAAWMAGRGKKPASLVGQEYWEELSPGSHADARHLRRMTGSDPGGHLHLFAGRFEDDWLACVVVALGAKDLALVGHTEARTAPDALPALERDIDIALDARERQLAFW